MIVRHPALLLAVRGKPASAKPELRALTTLARLNLAALSTDQPVLALDSVSSTSGLVL